MCVFCNCSSIIPIAMLQPQLATGLLSSLQVNIGLKAAQQARSLEGCSQSIMVGKTRWKKEPFLFPFYSAQDPRSQASVTIQVGLSLVKPSQTYPKVRLINVTGLSFCLSFIFSFTLYIFKTGCYHAQQCHSCIYCCFERDSLLCSFQLAWKLLCRAGWTHTQRSVCFCLQSGWIKGIHLPFVLAPWRQPVLPRLKQLHRVSPGAAASRLCTVSLSSPPIHSETRSLNNTTPAAWEDTEFFPNVDALNPKRL